MTEYMSVVPGIDMSAALGDRVLTKKWLVEYLAGNPQKDFRMYGRSSYVNGEDCIRYDLKLEVRRPSDSALVAVVDFRPDDNNVEWGYKAEVI
jgi:hypothetical protein